MTIPAKGRRPTTPAEPGIDLLRIRGDSIITVYRTWKGSGRGEPIIHCESIEASSLGHYLEYHPRVAYYQRADVPWSFVEEHGLDYRIPVPIIIPYPYEGALHDYYPDFVGWFDDGRLFLAEAGLPREKTRAEARAKAAAALDWVTAQGGEYWIGTSAHISEKRFDSLQMLHQRRVVFGEPPGIAEPTEKLLRSTSLSVRDAVQRLRGDFAPELIEAVAWRLLGQAHARGRLLFDFDDQVLTINSPVRIRSDHGPVLLPPALPSILDESSLPSADAWTDEPPVTREVLIIEPSAIGDEAKRDKFLRNQAIYSAIRDGTPVAKVAAKAGVSRRMVRYVVNRYLTHGELAFLPNGTYAREDPVDDAFQRRIATLLRGERSISAQEMADGAELEAVAKKLSRDRDAVVATPSPDQVRRIVRKLKHDGIELDRSVNGRRPRRWAGGGRISYVHRIRYPGALVEADEHYVDVLIWVAEHAVAIRVYCGVLVDVMTGCPLAAVLSPTRLNEDDYMRLIKMAMEPKDRLKQRYGYENDWPCTVKIGAVSTDNALIFTSRRSDDVLVKRLNIQRRAVPLGAASSKGVAEAILGFLTRRFGHRLPGTLMGSPEKRGEYDSEKAAERAGISFDELEQYFYQALVDGYLQAYDDTRDGKRVELWRRAVADYGAPQFTGSSDELKLLFMKRVNRKHEDGLYHVHHGGVSFLGKWYRANAEDVGHAIRGKYVELYYDRRDVVTIYVALNGTILGSLTCAELLSKYVRISEWELQELKKQKAPERTSANAKANTNMRGIYRKANAPKRERKRQAAQFERARAHDRQIGEIHTDEVLAAHAAAARGESPLPDDPGPVIRHGPSNVVPVKRLPVLRLPRR